MLPTRSASLADQIGPSETVADRAFHFFESLFKSHPGNRLEIVAIGNAPFGRPPRRPNATSHRNRLIDRVQFFRLCIAHARIGMLFRTGDGLLHFSQGSVCPEHRKKRMRSAQSR
ncbi:MAG: hypothetical protein JWO80_640 [Bryobacterales bacterium]|nr:hypothetical protein [Bryobacterales bacterium]